MKINLDNLSEDARIEIIPLIDVIFCILTFFILASLQLTRQQAISVALPQATTGVPQMREMLMVSLDDLGQVYVEQQRISAKDQLRQAVKNYHTVNPTGLMVLYAAKNASYSDVVQILDLLREIGGTQVALATLPSSTDQNSQVNPQVPPTSGSGLTPYSGSVPIDPANPIPGYTPYQPQLSPVIPTQPVQPTVPNSAKITTPSNTDAAPKR